jgi:Ran GTPase-activating protein (RanGAP) involved in mRNA processing and transport
LVQAGQLANASRITSRLQINLKSNRISRAGLQLLCRAVCTSLSLQQLELRQNPLISDAGCGTLADTLCLPTCSLKYLSLGECTIGNSGADALGRALGLSVRLETLVLTQNQISCAGAIALADGLRNNSKLVALYLNNNWVADDGAAALAEALTVNRTLRSLFLDGNRITDTGMSAMSQALSSTSILQEFVCGDNPISTGCVPAISNALAINFNLTSFSLCNCVAISDQGAASILEGCLSNVKSVLRSLRLSNCGIHDDGANAILSALRQRSSTCAESTCFLSSLDLGANDIRAETLLAIKSAVSGFACAPVVAQSDSTSIE